MIGESQLGMFIYPFYVYSISSQNSSTCIVLFQLSELDRVKALVLCQCSKIDIVKALCC